MTYALGLRITGMELEYREMQVLRCVENKKR
jgi:hypothetical protein